MDSAEEVDIAEEVVILKMSLVGSSMIPKVGPTIRYIVVLST